MFAGSSDYGIHVFDLASEKQEPIDTWTQHENYVSAALAGAGTRFIARINLRQL